MHCCSLAVALGERRTTPAVSFVVRDSGHLGRFSDPDGITIECNVAIDDAGDGSSGEPVDRVA